MSDLHLEFSDYRPDPVDADVVVLAGDIDTGTSGLEWAARQFPDIPVVYVAGNHEYYDQDMLILRKELAEAAGRLGIHFLDDREVIIGTVRFIGCTLWTDLASQDGQKDAMQALSELMNDYQLVSHGDRLLCPDDTLAYHKVSRAYLECRLTESFHGRTVVVTHHAPSLRSIPADRRNTAAAIAYASNLESLVEGVDIWIHGHTHERQDYQIGQCRVLCNPRGYQNEFYRQATGFDQEALIIL
jgi:predicted phosphodiesterase